MPLCSLHFPLLVFALALAAPLAGAEWRPSAPVHVGTLPESWRNETSGLAASRRADDVLWTHNDSQGAPVLRALWATGAVRGRLRIEGVRNHDWEDVAAFEHGGRAWLLIGDVGDNDADREHVWLHVVAEPELGALSPERELHVKPEFSLRVRYEDGPHDCESIAVDGHEGAAYLLTKRDDPARLYRIPLAPSDTVVVAKRVGTVARLPKPSPMRLLLAGHSPRRRPLPTSMDFAPDGSAAAVLTYGAVLIFSRRGAEPWAATLAREPLRLGTHHLPQAEALCFSRDGAHLFVASEESPRLLRFDRQ